MRVQQQGSEHELSMRISRLESGGALGVGNGGVGIAALVRIGGLVNLDIRR